MKRYVYAFSEGDGKNKRLLGGKGANLCEMTQIGLNVPPGFVISTEACLEYLENQALPPEPFTSAEPLNVQPPWLAAIGAMLPQGWPG